LLTQVGDITQINKNKRCLLTPPTHGQQFLFSDLTYQIEYNWFSKRFISQFLFLLNSIPIFA
jgi:hypothetical protein